MAELWSAILNPRGPNYSTWSEIFGVGRVPLKSPRSIQAAFGPEKDIEAYLLDLKAMTLAQRARLVGSLAMKFGAPIYEIEAEIARVGMPIRAVDVIVSYDMRAFA